MGYMELEMDDGNEVVVDEGKDWQSGLPAISGELSSDNGAATRFPVLSMNILDWSDEWL